MLNTLFILLILTAILAILFFLSYFRWKHNLIRTLEQGSRIIQTSMGPVEYADLGEGPILFISHGGGSGYDNLYMYRFLTDQGFRLICPSKPGYLRTPLSVGATFEEHADLFATLLDTLGIQEKVAILGLSLGGPAALQFALRHPERTAGILMQDAVSMAYSAKDEAANSLIGRAMLSPLFRNILNYVMFLSTRAFPESTFKQYMQVVTTYNSQEIESLTQRIMGNPEDRRSFIEFSNAFSPMSLRAPGMDNELAYAKNLPRYPLETIQCPVLVTHSTVDKDVDPEHAYFVAQSAPHAQLYTFQGCGHLFWFGSEWEEIQQKTLEFLRSIFPNSKTE